MKINWKFVLHGTLIMYLWLIITIPFFAWLTSLLFTSAGWDFCFAYSAYFAGMPSVFSLQL